MSQKKNNTLTYIIAFVVALFVLTNLTGGKSDFTNNYLNNLQAKADKQQTESKKEEVKTTALTFWQKFNQFDKTNNYNDERTKGLYQPLFNGHSGLDLIFKDKSQKALPSFVKGTVRFAGECNDNQYTQGSSYGSCIVINAFNGEWLYAHLSSINNLKQGESVEVGQVIGDIGNSGRSQGVHLHLAFKPDNANVKNGFDGFEDPLFILEKQQY